MLDYVTLKDEGGLEPWPPLEELPFVNVLDGNPVHEGRFDLGGFGMRTMAGVWQCTPGSFEYTYPGDEICTLLQGKVKGWAGSRERACPTLLNEAAGHERRS